MCCFNNHSILKQITNTVFCMEIFLYVCVPLIDNDCLKRGDNTIITPKTMNKRKWEIFFFLLSVYKHG